MCTFQEVLEPYYFQNYLWDHRHLNEEVIWNWKWKEWFLGNDDILH